MEASLKASFLKILLQICCPFCFIPSLHRKFISLMTSLAIGCLVTLLSIVLLIGAMRSHRGSNSVSLMTWNELVAQLQPVQTEGITALARDYLEPEISYKKRDPAEIWDLVGGVEGLTRMKENSDILLALASYAQHWNPEDGLIVAERMRRDDLALRRAVFGLAVGKTFGYGRSRVSAYVHEAASAYCLMRRRLLALYRESHSALYPVLDQHLEEAHVGSKSP